MWIYLAIALFLSVVLLKIYISNEIYYTSRELMSLYHKYTFLQEENRRLRMEYEKNRYRSQILDTLE